MKSFPRSRIIFLATTLGQTTWDRMAKPAELLAISILRKSDTLKKSSVKVNKADSSNNNKPKDKEANKALLKNWQNSRKKSSALHGILRGAKIEKNLHPNTKTMRKLFGNPKRRH